MLTRKSSNVVLVFSLTNSKSVEAKSKFLVTAWETEELLAFYANWPLTWCRLLICVYHECCIAPFNFAKEYFCMFRPQFCIKSVANSISAKKQTRPFTVTNSYLHKAHLMWACIAFGVVKILWLNISSAKGWKSVSHLVTIGNLQTLHAHSPL